MLHFFGLRIKEKIFFQLPREESYKDANEMFTHSNFQDRILVTHVRPQLMKEKYLPPMIKDIWTLYYYLPSNNLKVGLVDFKNKNNFFLTWPSIVFGLDHPYVFRTCG